MRRLPTTFTVCSATLALTLALAACGSKESPPPAPAPSTPAPTTTPAPAPAATFDLAAVPLAPTAGPIALELPLEDRPVDAASTTRLAVVAGKSLLRVEGTIARVATAKLSTALTADAAWATLTRGLTAAGCVRVDEVQPTTDAAVVTEELARQALPDTEPAALLRLAHHDEGDYRYGAFVRRSATDTTWVIVQASQFTVHVTVVTAPAA